MPELCLLLWALHPRGYSSSGNSVGSTAFCISVECTDWEDESSSKTRPSSYPSIQKRSLGFTLLFERRINCFKKPVKHICRRGETLISLDSKRTFRSNIGRRESPLQRKSNFILASQAKPPASTFQFILFPFFISFHPFCVSTFLLLSLPASPNHIDKSPTKQLAL